MVSWEFKLTAKWEYVMIACLTVCWLYREYSWSSHSARLVAEIGELSELRDSLLLKIDIDRLTAFSCDSNFDPSSLAAPILPDRKSSGFHLMPALYDWHGLALVAGLASAVFFENRYLHEVGREEEDSPHKAVVQRVNEFVAKKHPLTTFAVMLLVLLSAPLAWLGIFDRAAYVRVTFKVLLAFSSASILAFVLHNALRLRKYMPEDREAWATAMRDPHWWLWAASRLVGIHDLSSGTGAVLWLGCVLWYSWPLRYFYYHGQAACAAASAQQREAVALFLVNMAGHSALLGVCVFLLYLLVIVPPLPAGAVPPLDAEGRPNPAAAYDNALMRLWTRVQRRFEVSAWVAVLSFVSVGNSLLALLRVLWFVSLTNPCGFYSSCVAWMFAHAHVGMSLFALPVVNALMQRCAVVETYRAPFARKFREESEKAGGGEGGGDPEAVAVELFDSVLVVAALYFVFVAPHEKSEDKGPDGRPLDVSLHDVFQAMLQTELYAHQHPSPADDEDAQAEAEMMFDTQPAQSAGNEAAEPEDSTPIHD